MTTIDPRLPAAGLLITPVTLAEIFRDHFPGSRLHHRGQPAPTIATHCPGCGTGLTAADPECSTMRLVRPLLARRRFEDQDAVSTALTAEQWEDLTKVAPVAGPAASTVRRRVPKRTQHRDLGLFDADPYRRTPSTLT